MRKPAVPDATSSALKQRLREAVDEAGGVVPFSRLSSIPKDTLNKYLAGTQPGPAALVKIADAARSSVDVLLGRAASGNTLIARAAEPVEDLAIPEGFVPVSYLDVRASAGRGRVSLPAETVAAEHFLFSRAWLRSLGVAADAAELLQAEGDSMYSTIHDGDLMLVDRGFGEPVHGKIYALVVRDAVVVKRVNFLAAGGMVLISDNERYPSETIRRDEVGELNFQGRVAWYGRAI